MKNVLKIILFGSYLTASTSTSLAEQATRQTSLAEQATRQTSLAVQATRQTSLAEQATRQTSLAEQATRQTSLAEQATRQTSAQVARSAPAQSSAQNTCASAGDRAAVQQVMQNFIRSLESSDINLMRSTFRSDGLLVGYSKSKAQVVTESNEEWSKGFTGTPADDEAHRRRSFEILDVTATGAVSKVLLDYPTWSGIDYIALSKINGRWMIISKSWTPHSVPAATR